MYPRFLLLLTLAAASTLLTTASHSWTSTSFNPGATANPQTPTISQPVTLKPTTPMPADDATLTSYSSYRDVIDKTVAMVSNSQAKRLVQELGLDILNVTWEDTGRYQNSAVGPNISDMTIQVQQRHPRTQDYQLSLMPVIRHPNFSDKTGDVDLDRFFLMVGNEKDQPLRQVSLREFLGEIRRYLSQPDSWKGRQTSLLADRDTHVLVSAQACFLPVPQAGIAEFNPVLFNYQSYAENPAVLTILATREGTSVTIIDNQRDGFAAGATWGQRLFFNQNGERASLTGQRQSDFQTTPTTGGERSTSPDQPTSSNSAGLNTVLLIQVPLKQKSRPLPMVGAVMMAPAAMEMDALSRGRSDVENAVIGHGAVEGPFTEIANLEIERDPRFPIRVTVQFYKATSNGVIARQDVQQIQQQIARVYEEADYVGSLVTGGATGRPTKYEGSKQEPPNWWNNFWQRQRSKPED